MLEESQVIEELEEKKESEAIKKPDRNPSIPVPKKFPSINYLNTEIIPNNKDLTEKDINLATMPKDKKFDDHHIYLDCVFRLLREDAIRPLREGLKALRIGGARDKVDPKVMRKLARDSGVRLYQNVEIRGIEALDYQGCVAFNLRISDKAINKNWVSSKKLLPGSLFIISFDNFMTHYVGIVKLRDGKKMSDTATKYRYIEFFAEVLHHN